MDWYERWQQEWSSSQKDNANVVYKTFYQIAPEVLDKRYLLTRWRGTRVTAAKMEDKGQIQVKELTVSKKLYRKSKNIRNWECLHDGSELRRSLRGLQNNQLKNR